MIRLHTSRHEAILCDFTQLCRAKREGGGKFTGFAISYTLKNISSAGRFPGTLMPIFSVTISSVCFLLIFTRVIRLGFRESSVVSNGLIMKFLEERDLRAALAGGKGEEMEE